MADFSRYMDVPMENVSAQKPLPLGHYLATFVGFKTAERTFVKDEGNVPILTLQFKTQAPCDDVEPSDLGADGGIGTLVSKDYRFNPPAKDGKVEGGAHQAVRRIAEDIMGLDTKGLSLGDTLAAMKGSQVKLHNEPRQDKNDPDVSYTNITKVLSAD